MISRIPIRLRLTLPFAVAMALVLAGMGLFVYVRVGSALLSSVDQNLRAQIGEMSGHVFFADIFYGFDDALYCGLRLLNILANAKESLADMRDGLPQPVNSMCRPSRTVP